MFYYTCICRLIMPAILASSLACGTEESSGPEGVAQDQDQDLDQDQDAVQLLDGSDAGGDAAVEEGGADDGRPGILAAPSGCPTVPMQDNPRAARISPNSNIILYYGEYNADVTTNGVEAKTQTRVQMDSSSRPVVSSSGVPLSGATPLHVSLLTGPNGNNLTRLGEHVLLQRGVGDCRLSGMSAPKKELTEWINQGGKVAYLHSRRELEGRLQSGKALPEFKQLLSNGFSYIAIDELSNYATGTTPDEIRLRGKSWENGGAHAQLFAKLLKDLANAGLDRRIILYANSYNMLNQFGAFAAVLQACEQHCRVLASEIYIARAQVRQPLAAQPARQNDGRDRCTPRGTPENRPTRVTAKPAKGRGAGLGVYACASSDFIPALVR